MITVILYQKLIKQQKHSTSPTANDHPDSTMNPKISKYYKILNIHQDCSDLELRRAYRRLALQIHPDKASAKSTLNQFEVLNKIYNRLIMYRKKQADIGIEADEESSRPIPMYFGEQHDNIFNNIQANFSKHLQTLDHIMASLKSMSIDGSVFQKVKAAY